VKRPHPRAPARQPTAHLHEAARVAGHEAVGAGALHVGQLLVEDGRGDVGQPDRERAAEAAALVGLRKLHQLNASEALEQFSPRRRLTQAAQQMAGIMVGHRALEGRLDAVHAEHLDQELGELARLCREPLGRCPERRVVLEQAGELGLDHPGAGARGHDHVLRGLEQPDRARRHFRGPGMVARVEERHPAAGLPLGEVHLDAQPPEQSDHGHPDLGEEQVAQARDHERGLHGLLPPGPPGVSPLP